MDLSLVTFGVESNYPGTMISVLRNVSHTPADMQVDAATIHKMAQKNNTIYQNRYLLDVNPNYAYRKMSDTNNVIDARFIDTQTGCFIDVTVVVPAITFLVGIRL